LSQHFTSQSELRLQNCVTVEAAIKNNAKVKVNKYLEQSKKDGLYDQLIRQESDLTKIISETSHFDLTETKSLFPREFYEYLIDLKLTVLDTEAFLFPKGLWIPFRNSRLHPGLFEDFLLFSSNHHPLLSCIFATPDGPISGLERLQMYIVRYALAFAITAMEVPLFQAVGIAEHRSIFLSKTFSIFCVIPLCAFLSHLAGVILSTFSRCLPALSERSHVLFLIIQGFGHLSVLAVVMWIFFLLFFASIFSNQKEPIELIQLFFVNVIIPPFFFQLLRLALLFIPHFHIEISLFGGLVLWEVHIAPHYYLVFLLFILSC